ncbi:MAG: hypothetical protein L0154_25780 [Chloroflexi bacterium]|nr:hypothetical protein [Chloroflexota bacterium]
MHKKLLVIILLLGLSFALLGNPSPSEAGTIIVDGNCTLVDAIIAANTDAPSGQCPAGNDADLIILDVDTYLTEPYNGTENGLPEITSNIHILARNGSIVSGNSTNFRLFQIACSVEVVLEGLTITSGRLTGSVAVNGGAITNTCGDLVLQNVHLIGNSAIASGSARAYGGAMYGPATIINSVFENNVAQSQDSNASGGAIYQVNWSTIENSIFRNNKALGGGVGGATGGAIFGDGNYYIRDTVFENNQANGGNTGEARGGAILSYSSLWEISSTIFLNNNATTTAGYAYGGALFVSQDQPNIINSTFSGNFARSNTDGNALGGAIFAGGTFEAEINFSTFISNEADQGAILYESSDMDYTISHSILIATGQDNDCVGVLGGSGNLTNGDQSCSSIASGTIIPGTHIETGAADNGGNTLTHALINTGDNPAINGNPGCTLTTDQRGLPRDIGCDIGAFEYQFSDFLEVNATCEHPDLKVVVLEGQGPFNITASGGGNVPVTVGYETSFINGPDKWDDLTVTEQSGDGQSINLGQFKCRPLEIPTPLMPPHQSRTTNTSPTFSWTSIPDANRYRVFLFDDKVAASRTVDMRQNTIGSETSLVFQNPLPIGRLFWRVRGRVNNVWGYWSIRFTLFVDPPTAQESVVTPVPTIQLDAPTSVPVPTLIQPPNSR